MSPMHRDQRREDAEGRLVEAHAADVNGEQHRQERRNPPAIGGRSIVLRRLQSRAGFGQLRTIEADVGDDALVDVVLGVRPAQS